MKRLFIILFFICGSTFAQTEVPCGTDSLIYKHTNENAGTGFNVINSQLFALRDTIWWSAAVGKIHWLPADTAIVSHTIGISTNTAQNQTQWRFDYLYNANSGSAGFVNMYFMYRGNIFCVYNNSLYGGYKIQKFNTITKVFTTPINAGAMDYGGGNFIKYPYLASDSSFNTINYCKPYNGQTDYKWMWYKPLDDSSSTTSIGDLGIAALPSNYYYYPISFFNLSNAEYLFLAATCDYPAGTQTFTTGYPVKMIKHTGTVKNAGWETATNLDSVKTMPVIAVNSTRTKAYILFTSLSRNNTYHGLCEFDGTAFTKIPLPSSLTSDTLMRVNSFSLLNDDELFVSFTADDTIKTTNRIYEISSQKWRNCSTARFSFTGYPHGTNVRKSDIHSAVLNNGLLFVASKYQGSAEYGFGRIDIHANAYVNQEFNAHYGVFCAVNYVPYIPIIPDTLNFLTPLDGTHYVAGDTIHVTWYASKDSIRLYYLGDSVDVNGTSYNLIAPDTTVTFNIFGKVIGALAQGTDIISSLEIFTHKYLRIDSVYMASNNLYINTSSVRIDSIKYYIKNSGSWTGIGTKIVTDTSVPAITSFVKNFTSSLYVNIDSVKVLEYRDTTISITPVNYYSIGALYDGRICYYATGGNNIETFYRLDQACGWNVYNSGTYGYITLKVDTSGALYYERVTGAGIPNPCGCDDPAHYPYCPGKSMSTPIFLDGDYPSAYAITAFHNPFNFTGNNVITNKSYVYHYLNKKIYVDDLVNNRTNMLYCDLTNLYAKSTIYSFPVFVGNGVQLTAYNMPYQSLLHLADSLHHNIYNSASCFNQTAMFYTYGVGNSPVDVFGLYDGLSTAELNSVTAPSYFEPSLIISDNAGFNRVVSVPLLPYPPDVSPLLYDTKALTSKVIITRNYFRGIHPKIWKYGNINGVKP